MKLELKCFYPSRFKINDNIFIVLNRFKPDEETEFFIHEIKAQSLVVHDYPKKIEITNINQTLSNTIQLSSRIQRT